MQDNLTEALKQRKDYLGKVISSKTKALADAPEGRLNCRVRKGTTEYYHVTVSGDKNGKYIPVSEHDKVRFLAQKAYDQSVLRIAEQENKLVNALLKYKSAHSLTDPVSKYSNRSDLITPIQLTDKEYIEKWLNRDYERLRFADDAPALYSKNGERVRSKSELIIADTLQHMKVPYLCEVPLFLDGWGPVSPDFMILNVRLRKTLFWEHFGMMDNPDYCAKNLKKLEAYQRNGYYQGENLIVTFESSMHPLDTQHIKDTIRHYML